MPADWEEDFWNELSNEPSHGKQNKLNGSNGGTPSITLRPPLYNAEDYTTALKIHFSSHSSSSAHHKKKASVLIEHSTSSSSSPTGVKNGFYEKNVVVAANANGHGHGHHHHQSQNQANGHANSKSSPTSYKEQLLPDTPPEMSMRKFLNGSELLFKLEADLRHAFPSFVQEFVSGESEGVACLLEALKIIQASIDGTTGLREQRKLFMDELKCLHCIRLCLRNIEAVSKLAFYPGGLYPLASAMISTVTTTRIIALEILTCVCSEGGSDGHFKVSEAISTLRLRMGEPIRCKLLIGAISSAPPGTFQAKGIKFITAWVSSASSPKQKVHIQCELEEAGFNPQSLRKGAELGGARESREVQVALDAWNNVSIDVDTLTRQNGQLRNSVATLQQELATLKDKIKKMDVPQKNSGITNDSTSPRKQLTTPKTTTIRAEELVTTPVDSEEEAEQIHQILEDLNNIVNSEMNQQQPNNINKKSSSSPDKFSKDKKEKEIVPMNLVKPPPKKVLVSSAPLSVTPGVKSPAPKPPPRPWPTSSASEDYYDEEDEDEDDDDSDIIQPELSNKKPPPSATTANKKITANSSSESKPKINVVRQVVEKLENNFEKLQQQQQQHELNSSSSPSGGNGGGKLYVKHTTSSSPINKSSKSSSPIMTSAAAAAEPKPDYYCYKALPNFHKQNHMANKFVNFKSSKLYSSSPDNSFTGIIMPNHHINSRNDHKSLQHHQLPVRISPTLEKVQRNSSKQQQQQQLKNGKSNKNGGGGGSQLRRSESLHTSLTSIIFPRKEAREGLSKEDKKLMKWNQLEVEKWKSVDNLHYNDMGIEDDDDERSNFTLAWRYPGPSSSRMKSSPTLLVNNSTSNSSNNTSPKSDEKSRQSRIRSSNSKNQLNNNGKSSPDKKSSSTSQIQNLENSNNFSSNNNVVRGVFELYTDYRQSRFTCNNNNNNNVNFHGANGSPKQSSKGSNSPTSNNNNGGGGGLGFFSRYSKKSSKNNNNPGINSSSGGSNSSGNSGILPGTLQNLNDVNNVKNKKKGRGKTSSSNNSNTKNNLNVHPSSSINNYMIEPNLNNTGYNHVNVNNGKEQNLSMFSLPPIFVSQGIDMANHRICDLPSGLY